MEDKLDPKTRQDVLKAQAVRQAMVEVLAEHRAEILKRARAKLTAMGVELAAEDVELSDAPVS